MKVKNVFVTLLSNRILWGSLAGFATWLILALVQHVPLGYSPAISIIISMLISRLYGPKRLAGLSAGIGILAGAVFGTQLIFQEISPIDFGAIVFAPILVGLISVLSSLVFAFYGFIIGTIARLYKKGRFFSNIS